MSTTEGAADAEFARAMDHRRRRDWRAASLILDELVTRAGASAIPVWRGRLVECLARLGEAAAAREAATPLLQLAGLHGASFIETALALIDMGDAALARQLAALLRPDPRVAAATTLLQGALAEAAGERAAAEVAYAEAMALGDSFGRAAMALLRLRAAPLPATPPAPVTRQQELEAALEQNPADSAPRWELVRLLARQPEAALPHWHALFAAAPDDADVALGLARAAHRGQQPAVALPAWQAVLAQRPGLPEALLGQARAFSALGLKQEAAAGFIAVLAAPAAEAAQLAEAARHFISHDNRRAEAIAAVRPLLPAHPKAAALPLALGRVLERDGQATEAEAMLRRAAALAPEDAGIAGHLAQLLFRLGPDEAALAAAQHWLALAPGDAAAQLHRLRVLAGLERLAEARDGYLAFLAREPEHFEATVALAWLHRRCGAAEQALRCWRRATVLRPEATEPWLRLVSDLAATERDAEAEDAFADCRAALGESPEALLAQARILESARWRDRAEPLYQAAAEALPNDARPPAALGGMLLRAGELDRALPHLRRARLLDPASSEVTRDLAEARETLLLLGEDPAAPERRPPVVLPERLFEELARLPIPAVEAVPGRVVLTNSSLAAGGAERQLVTTLRGLASATSGVESVSLVCRGLDPVQNRDFYLPDVLATGCTLIRTDAEAAQAGAPDTDPVAQALAAFLGRFPRDLGPLATWVALLRRLRPAVVHCWQDMNSLGMGTAAVLAGVPRVILSMRSLPPDRNRWLLRRWMRDGFRALLAQPGVRMLNNSRAGAEGYAAWLGTPPDSIGVIYNGVDLGVLDAARDPGETARIKVGLGIPPSAPVVGGVFRIQDVKRPMLWVETAALVARARPDVHFVVCGGGPLAPRMRAMAEAEGIGDRLHLPGSQARIALWYGLMDAVLLTSRYEGLPNVLLEAQHFGVPVVVPKVGGAPEALDEGATGFAVPGSDAAALAERVLFCLADAEWRERVRTLGPAFVSRRFGIGSMVAATLVEYGLAAGGE